MTLKELNKKFKYLHLSESGSIWVRLGWRKEREHIGYKFNPESPDLQVLSTINAAAKTVVENPDKYFWCTNCNIVHEHNKLCASVFAGYYCKKCAVKDKNITALLNEAFEFGLVERR